MEKITKINVEGHEYGLVAGNVAAGSCASAAADWTKIVLLEGETGLVDGMFLSVEFTYGNTAGFDEPKTVYSSDGVNFFYDQGMTEAVTLPPVRNYTVTPVSGTEYLLEEYPVISIANTAYPVCNARGKPCGGAGLWSDGDTVIVLFVDEKFLVLSAGSGGSGAGITVYDTEEELEEALPGRSDGDIVATYGDGKNEFQDAPLGSIMEYLGTSDPSDGKWLICDGRDTTGTAIELETHYPSLYMFLGGTNVLPDLREMVLVGAGQNDTDNIGTHDVYTLGQFKDDQIQNITGSIVSSGYSMGSNARSVTTDTGALGSGTYTKKTCSGDSSGSNYMAEINFDASRSARTGTTTHGKQKGVNYIIKAISEVDTYHLPSSEIATVEQYVDAGLNTVESHFNTKIGQSVNYSTTEQLTGGTWIDGKPIYRKVVDCGALPNNANKTVAHNISNLETVVKLYAITSKGDDWMPLPEYYNNSGGIGISLTTTGVFIQTYSNRSTYTSTYAIIEYTKSTD